VEIDGQDLRKDPLLQRKAKLKKLLRRKGRDGLQYVDHLEGDGRGQRPGLVGFTSSGVLASAP
jgi:ATP-dependent DNA ligase